MDNPENRHPGLPWDEQDVVARRASLTRILVRISREALQGDGLDSILKGICDCLVAELPVPLAAINLLDETATEFVQEVWTGELSLDPNAIAVGWSVERGAIGRCARLGVPQLILDTSQDPDYVPANANVRSEYLVPIRHRDRLHGVLNIESTRSDFFDAEACAIFDAVADLVAAAIHFARMADELRQVNRRFEQLSMLDGLTGIANRRRFDQRLQALWKRMAFERRPLALLMVDADAFKPLNDACGHLYGDECLRELARVSASFADEREGLVARFGGEELALLLPGRELESARAVAEELRVKVGALALDHPASSVASYVTVSIGVAAVIPEIGRPPEHLIAAADRALYSAKRQGRNRVCTESVDP